MPFKLENDSYAPLVMEVVFRTPEGLVDVPSHDYFQSFHMENATDSMWKGTLNLFDTDGDFIENLVLRTGFQGEGGGVLLRWNWDTPLSGGLVAAPLYQAEVAQYEPEFTPEGATLTLDLLGTHTIVSVLDLRSRSFPAGMKISDIFRVIAADRGWTLESGGRSTIEETDAVLEKPLNSYDESDIKFIDRHLLPEAVNADGQHFEFFFETGTDVVHFHSRHYLPSVARAKYRFARDAMGRVLSFAPSDNSFTSFVLGGGNAVYESIGSLDGTKTKVEATAQGGVPGQRNSVMSDAGYLSSLPFRAGRNATVASKRAVTARYAEELARKVKARHSRLSSANVEANLQVLGEHRIEPWSYVTVEYIKKNGLPHYLSGSYQVSNLEHDVSSSGWTLAMQVLRTGVQSVSEDQPEIDASRETVVTENSETSGSSLRTSVPRTTEEIPASSGE